MDALFEKFDTDKNGVISFDEFVDACHYIIVRSTSPKPHGTKDLGSSIISKGFTESAMKTAMELDAEEEEMPEEFADLPADQQQFEIKKRAFSMLALGTFLVLLFSGMYGGFLSRLTVFIPDY